MTALRALAGMAIVMSSIAAAPQVFRSTTDVVPVYVTVTDRDGRLVPNLTRDDFTILDNGRPQPITLFDSSPQPLRMIALFDVSGSMAEHLPLLRRACLELVGQLRQDDLARVGTFGQRIGFSPAFTRAADELTAPIPKSVSAAAPTPLWQAVDDAMNELRTAPPGRRVVLVLSDGKDTGPEAGQRLVTAQAVRGRAERDDIMVYGVGLRSAPGPVAPGGVRSLADVLSSPVPDPSLGELALGTGGGYVELRAAADLAGAFARVVEELHRQYLLGFVPAGRDGLLHFVDVRLRDSSLKPHARRTYLAPK
jgi:Ca-activated chloride channel family protein